MIKTKPDLIDKHVGIQVLLGRLALGMTQEEVARAVGISFQQVQKYENGHNRIAASRLRQLAGVLQIPIAFFSTARHVKPNPTLARL